MIIRGNHTGFIHEDRLRIYKICKDCEKSIEIMGMGETLEEPEGDIEFPVCSGQFAGKGLEGFFFFCCLCWRLRVRVIRQRRNVEAVFLTTDNLESLLILCLLIDNRKEVKVEDE